VKRLALVPIFLAGFFAGTWLLVAPWVVGFPPGVHGGWGASRWSTVWAGVIVVSVSGIALVTTVGLAVAAATRGGGDATKE
jgi:hypothetical protein